MVFHLLHPKLREALAELGYSEPTPAQRLGIPPILEGKNVLLIAPTGYGKTEAALFPVVSRLLGAEAPQRGIKCLYITPLRSLNRDLLRRLYALAEAVGLSVAVRHSDTPESERRSISAKPPDILITTPESLQILLLHRKIRPALRSVRHVIVDEIHELVSSKRGVQLALGLERLSILAGEFQRIGLSATVGAPRLVAEFLGGGRPVEVVDASGEKVYEIDVALPQPTDEDYADSEKFDATPETVARVKRVAEYVASSRGSVLIFTNTRDGAEFLSSRLKLILGDVVEVHHSSLSREHRVSVEERLKSGDLKAVVATSSLELGIDIGEVDLVIQYGSPRQVSKLLQRVGRSGHRLGRASRGFVVAGDFEDLLESEEITKRALEGRLEPDVEYHENALDVLLHQVVGMALEARLDGRELDSRHLISVIRRAHPFRNITEDDIKLVIDFAERHGLLKGLRPRRGSLRYYFENVSTIPDEQSYRAVDETTGKTVGELDREFVFSIEPGTKIVLSGRVWRFTKREGSVVYLYPEYDVTGALPAWLGEQIPVPYEVAQEVCKRRRELLLSVLRGEVEGLVDTEGLSPDGVPGLERLHVHIVGNKYAVVHSCLGNKGNEALGLYLSHALSGYVGPVGYRSDAYRVLLIFRDHVPTQAFVEVLKKPESFIYKTLRNAVKNSKMFRYRFLQVAKRCGVVSKDAEDVPYKLWEVYLDDLPGIEAANEIFIDRLDVKAMLSLIKKIERGEVEVVFKRLEKPTALEKPILEEALRLDFSFRGLSKDTLADLTRKRILNRPVTLLCLNCGWTLSTKAYALGDEVRCQNCGMGVLAVVKGDLAKARQVLNKFKIRQRLSPEEKKMLENLQQSASVVLEHGKLGVLVQLAHGVGPKTAVKILNRVVEGEDLWGAILDAERQYAATRAFWD
ncbi:MAG: DEAD/DEAH box helicase [Pyrobaculum sp.]